MDIIDFDKEKVEQLRKEYNKAVEEQQPSFFFQGKEFLTSYAKYLLEYLDNIFKNKK